MGEEISTTEFRPENEARFQQRLRRETDLLRSWFDNHIFCEDAFQAGLELEAWLIGTDGLPVPENSRFLAELSSPLVLPELSKFNFEFNVSPRYLSGHGLDEMERELRSTWQQCESAASRLGYEIVAIGILPTVSDAMLCVENLSSLKRYAAMNERVLRLRQGRPITLRLAGIDALESQHYDVMLEAAATSLQVHLKVPLAASVRYYNASLLCSPFTVALAANAPLLFGHCLWDDTRIPLFEQAVDTGGRVPRVTFGQRYVSASLLELFEHNCQEHRVLLPVDLPDAPQQMAHVRLHNGTIWNWNRPLIGFEADGRPHLRIEHRPMSASPTLVDLFADATLYFGLVHHLATMIPPPESTIDFDLARQNFYAAARFGLAAEVFWLDGQTHRLGELLRKELLPRATEALANLEVSAERIRQTVDIIQDRIETGQNGAIWQRRAFEKFSGDRQQTLAHYRLLQQRGAPVHTWHV